jgi:hypothetical protein
VEAARYFTAVDLNHWQRLHCRKSLARHPVINRRFAP